MDIARYAGIRFYSDDGQASFTDNKSPEINENNKPLCQFDLEYAGFKTLA
jgi:hypothetical protein